MLTIKQCVVGYVLLLLHHRPSLSVFLQAALTTTKTSATHSGFLRYYELVIIFLPSPLLSYTLSSSLSESNIRLSVPRNKYDEVVPREIPNNLLNYSLLLFLLRGTSNVSWKRCNSLFSGYYLLFIHLMCSSLMSVFWVWMDGTARWFRQRSLLFSRQINCIHGYDANDTISIPRYSIRKRRINDENFQFLQNEVSI